MHNQSKPSASTTSSSPVSAEPSIPEKTDPFVDAWKWMISGHNKADILEALAEKFPSANPQEVMVRALEAFAVAVKEPKEIIDGYCLEAYRGIYQKCLDTGDYSGALSAIKEIARLNERNKSQMPVTDYLTALKK